METAVQSAVSSNSRRSDRYLLVQIVAALALFPIARLLAFAFSASGDNATSLPAALHNPVLLRMLGASSAVALISTVFAAFAGYAISRAEVRGGRSKSGTTMFPVLFGSAMLILPLYLGIALLGLIPRQLAGAAIYALIALPFCIARLKLAADTITPAMLDAARLDGCSGLDLFRLIVLPALNRALLGTAVFCLALEWNLRVINHLVSSVPSARPVTAAFALLLSMPLVIMFLFLNKQPTVDRNAAAES